MAEDESPIRAIAVACESPSRTTRFCTWQNGVLLPRAMCNARSPMALASCITCDPSAKTAMFLSSAICVLRPLQLGGGGPSRREKSATVSLFSLTPELARRSFWMSLMTFDQGGSFCRPATQTVASNSERIPQQVGRRQTILKTGGRR